MVNEYRLGALFFNTSCCRQQLAAQSDSRKEKKRGKKQSVSCCLRCAYRHFFRLKHQQAPANWRNVDDRFRLVDCCVVVGVVGVFLASHKEAQLAGVAGLPVSVEVQQHCQAPPAGERRRRVEVTDVAPTVWISGQLNLERCCENENKTALNQQRPTTSKRAAAAWYRYSLVSECKRVVQLSHNLLQRFDAAMQRWRLVRQILVRRQPQQRVAAKVRLTPLAVRLECEESERERKRF